MLAKYYRWQVYNGTGVTVTVTLDVQLWKLDSSGATVFSAESTPISASAISAGSYSNSSTVNNSSDKYFGAKITALFDVSSSATGAVTVFLQESTDDGTTWPSDGGGMVVGSYYFNASSTDRTQNFEA